MATAYDDNSEFVSFCQKYNILEITRGILRQNCLTRLADLAEISEDELRELGIVIGQRKAIIRAMREYQDSSSLTTTFEDMVISKISNEVPKVVAHKIAPGKSSLFKQFRGLLELPLRLKAYASKLFLDDLPTNPVSLQEKCGNLEIYRCELREVWRNDIYKIRKCISGEVNPYTIPKTIIMVGATGSGKSTLIDGMANYVFQVDWKQKYRMKLVDLTPEEKLNKVKGESVSQTDWITVYTIPHAEETNTQFTLNIVDTPGFGDTRGIERDEQLVRQVKYFFENTKEHHVDSVNGICFVAQAPQSRLTPTQKYIFDSILSMFGNNVVENLFIMATFADGSKPPLISSIEAAEVPFKKYFPFNNSALFSPTKDQSMKEEHHIQKEFIEMFWKLGNKSFENFFQELERTTEQSLTLSADVLKEREKLSNSITYLQHNIKVGCQKLLRLEAEQEVVQKHKTNIDENRNFEYEVDQERIVTVPVPAGQYTTNCSHCHTTCHEDCKIANDAEKYHCIAIDDDGDCEVCPDRCSWSKHYNQGYVHRIKIEKVKKTYFDMKARYDDAKMKTKTQKKVFRQLHLEYQAVYWEVETNIETARKCLLRLQAIALKPDPLSDAQYIQLLIFDEKKQMEPGWESRIEMLEKIKGKAAVVTMVQSSASPKALMKSSLKE